MKVFSTWSCRAAGAMRLTMLGMLVLGATAFAGEYQQKFDDAFSDFTRRGENVALGTSCANKAGEAAKAAATPEEKYNALVLQSRCTYYVGVKTSGDDAKVEIFKRGKALADVAKTVMPDRAEAYYFYGINLGRWAEANGIMKSLGERHNLRRTMEAVLVKAAKDDEGRDLPGKEYDGWGANRTLGRMYFKLPGVFGGDNQKAERLLREAVANSPKDYPNALNVYYLAEVLVANGKKAEAKQILDQLISFEGKPEKYNPRRVPETLDEIALSKALRKELGN